MMKPICKTCHRFFRPKKNGLYFTEGAPKDNDAPPGLEAPERWRPYKVWMGDLWQCPDCHTQIIVGTGREPISESFKAGFQEEIALHDALFQVNDC